MAEIISYPVNTTVLETDLLLGTHIPQPSGSKPTSTKNFTVGSIVNLVNSRPYKVYTALLTQSGELDPTAVVLENTLGGALVWSYNVQGVFYGTLTGAFTLNKTTVLNNITNGNVHVTAVRSSVNDIQIQTRDLLNVNVNSSMNGMTIEIRVYN